MSSQTPPSPEFPISEGAPSGRHPEKILAGRISLHSSWRRGIARIASPVKIVLVFAAGVAVGSNWAPGKVLAGEPATPHFVAAQITPAEVVPTREVQAASDPTIPTRHIAQKALSITALIRGSGVYGAGLVVSAHHVLTCLHVVDRMKTIELSVAEGSFKRAQIIERDAALDLAVLRVEDANTAYARLASAADVQMGDPVFAMGAPRNMNFSLSSGIVSYAGRAYSSVYYLQTDLATNSGSSGGPVFDQQGRVVAISSFVLRDSQGLAFALPIDYAYRRFKTFFSEPLETELFDRWLAERAAKTARDAHAGRGMSARSRAPMD